MTVINPGGVLPANIGIFRQGLDAAKAAAIAPNLLWLSTDIGELFIANAAGNTYQSLAQTSASPFTAPAFRGNQGGVTRWNIASPSNDANSLQLTANAGVGIGPGLANGAMVDAVLGLGHGLRVAEGANAKQGTYGPLVAGTLAVANTSVTANSRIFVCRNPGGTNPGAHYVSALVAATSFTVTSTNAADTGGGFFIIFEPG